MQRGSEYRTSPDFEWGKLFDNKMFGFWMFPASKCPQFRFPTLHLSLAEIIRGGIWLTDIWLLDTSENQNLQCPVIRSTHKNKSLKIALSSIYAIVPLNVKAISLSCSTRLLNQPQFSNTVGIWILMTIWILHICKIRFQMIRYSNGRTVR